MVYTTWYVRVAVVGAARKRQHGVPRFARLSAQCGRFAMPPVHKEATRQWRRSRRAATCRSRPMSRFPWASLAVNRHHIISAFPTFPCVPAKGEMDRSSLIRRDRNVNKLDAEPGALSIYRSHSMTSAETGTMRESVCPSNANLRGDLEAGYLVPCLESTRTFPTIFFRSEPMPSWAKVLTNRRAPPG